jgi:hypothetical protein
MKYTTPAADALAIVYGSLFLSSGAGRTVPPNPGVSQSVEQADLWNSSPWTPGCACRDCSAQDEALRPIEQSWPAEREALHPPAMTPALTDTEWYAAAEGDPLWARFLDGDR